MATPPPPPPQQKSPQWPPAPAPPPKVHGTQCIWVGTHVNTSSGRRSAQMTSFHLLVGVTQGGIVPVTTRGARISLQPQPEQPLRISRTATVIKLRSSLSSRPIASQLHRIYKRRLKRHYPRLRDGRGSHWDTVPRGSKGS